MRKARLSTPLATQILKLDGDEEGEFDTQRVLVHWQALFLTGITG
jgi:hypothetical protein